MDAKIDDFSCFFEKGENAPDPFGDNFPIKNRKKQPQGRSKGAQSRKNEQLNIHAKIDAEKDMKSMPNGSKMIPKLMPKS